LNKGSTPDTGSPNLDRQKTNHKRSIKERPFNYERSLFERRKTAERREQLVTNYKTQRDSDSDRDIHRISEKKEREKKGDRR
jgi:hypothetical protein